MSVVRCLALVVALRGLVVPVLAQQRQTQPVQLNKLSDRLYEAKAAFSSGEAGLIEIIWNEVQKSGPSKP